MSPIKDADNYFAGKSKTWGVKAIDASTLQVTLANPAVYFLYDLTYPTFFVLEQSVKVGAPLTTTPSLIVGAGPWEIQNHSWNYRSKITLVPNPYYYEYKSIKLKEIDIVFTAPTTRCSRPTGAASIPWPGCPRPTWQPTRTHPTSTIRACSATSGCR